MFRLLHEEHFSQRRSQESAMRKEALRLAAALLPAILWIAAAPVGNVFA
jgi:hypothetical protein